MVYLDKTAMDELVSDSLLGKVKIDFDPIEKVFFLSIPIFYSAAVLPDPVKNYVESRKGRSFNPHKTSFKLESPFQVDLIQELPFQWGFQPSFREKVHAFRKLAAKCHHTLVEIAVEEKLRLAEVLLQFSESIEY